ncbi:reverse transcriptase [Cucumis melo var. makuwa]|uniref:Reverse transcriptase n=1 Tax=Cucumis melo var. makuwa TaxID=1194695 RepID=A0A5D3C0U3_CUCMM|nr:reverse transcriptase [Cucumis melo var. makuwa]
MLLHECHDTLWAGHPSWRRTYVMLNKGYFWLNMRVLTRPCESVFVDIITHLLKVGDHKAILAIINQFSKHAMIFACEATKINVIRKYEGLVEVLKKVGNTSYKVALPTWMIIDLQQKNLRKLKRSLLTRSESVENTRTIHEFLVKWKNLPAKETSWECAEDLTEWNHEIEGFKLR